VCMPRTKISEDADTAPVITRDGTRVEFQSTVVSPGQSVVLVVALDTPMSDPAFFMSTDPKDERVVAVEVTCGGVRLVGEPSPAEGYRFGHKFAATLGADVSVRVRNDGDQVVRVGASLVCQEARPRECSSSSG